MKPIPGLQDIQGLDAISWWPLAVGWWILIGLLLTATVILLVYGLKRRAKRRGWQYQILEKLNSLELEIGQNKEYEIAVELSELVRRLAIYRFSRKECANLSGESWLQWLTKNDPTQFDWLSSSHFLIEVPYIPRGITLDTTSLKSSIQAAKGWVK